MGDGWTEPGRSVADNGAIVYAWPPAGRFADLWGRFEDAGFSAEEKHELLALLLRWRDDNSRLVAFTDPATGEWVDVEWSERRTHHRLQTAQVMSFQSEEPVRIHAWCEARDWEWTAERADGETGADLMDRVRFEFTRHGDGLT